MGKTDLIIPIGVLGVAYYLWNRLQTPILSGDGFPGIDSPQGAQSGAHRRGGNGDSDDSDPLDQTDAVGLGGDIVSGATGGGGIIDTIIDIIVPKPSTAAARATKIPETRVDYWWDIPAYTPISPDYINPGEGVDRWI